MRRQETRQSHRSHGPLFASPVTDSTGTGHIARAMSRPVAQFPAPEPPPPEALQELPPGLYIISVASRILEMHPQTLRKYERAGLVRPSRTVGMLRLYSDDDIARLRIIKHLVDEVRLNLAGVEMVMTVVARLGAFRQRLVPTAAVSAHAFETELDDILRMLQGLTE